MPETGGGFPVPPGFEDGGLGDAAGGGGSLTGQPADIAAPETEPEFLIPETLRPTAPPDLPGFGEQRYDIGFQGVSGVANAPGVDLDDLRTYQIAAFANSANGIFTLNTPLNKFRSLSVDIINPNLSNAGLPHWAIEDTLEWVNSGSPSHLSQIADANMINSGIVIERVFPGLMETCATPYQARYIVPCNRGWYDSFNSTIDYLKEENINNSNIALPYASSVIYVEALSEIWVGGIGGIVAIGVESLNISSVNIGFAGTPEIRDMKIFNSQILILTSNELYIYDIASGEVTRDRGVGLPDSLFSVGRINRVFVIGANDGVYVRREEQTSWRKIIESSPVRTLIVPDAIFAVTDEATLFSSTNGFEWNNKGAIGGLEEGGNTGRSIAKIEKFFVSFWTAIGKQLFRDDGTFYTNSPKLTLTEEFETAQINDMVEFDDRLYFCLSDGRYGFITGSAEIPGSDATEVNVQVFTDSDLPAIHKLIAIDGNLWLFGYNRFKIVGQDGVFNLSTGQRF